MMSRSAGIFYEPAKQGGTVLNLSKDPCMFITKVVDIQGFFVLNIRKEEGIMVEKRDQQKETPGPEADLSAVALTEMGQGSVWRELFRKRVAGNFFSAPKCSHDTNRQRRINSRVRI